MKMDFLGRCVSELYVFSLTPPPAVLGHMLGAPGGALCLPCRPCAPSPSPHTSPEKCEVISPRQALVLSPQMFAQSTAASRGPGAEVSVGWFERGHKAFSVLCSPPLPPLVPRPEQVALCPASPRELERARLEKCSVPSSSCRVLQQILLKHTLGWINVLAVTSLVRSSVTALTSHVLLKCSHFRRDVHNIAVSPKGKVSRSSSTAIVNRD